MLKKVKIFLESYLKQYQKSKYRNSNNNIIIIILDLIAQIKIINNFTVPNQVSMNSGNPNQNVENNVSHGNMSISYSIPVPDNPNLTLTTTNDNSNANINGGLNENDLNGNFIPEYLNAYNNENQENEDEKINGFDISRINSNKSNQIILEKNKVGWPYSIKNIFLLKISNNRIKYLLLFY